MPEPEVLTKIRRFGLGAVAAGAVTADEDLLIESDAFVQAANQFSHPLSAPKFLKFALKSLEAQLERQLEIDVPKLTLFFNPTAFAELEEQRSDEDPLRRELVQLRQTFDSLGKGQLAEDIEELADEYRAESGGRVLDHLSLATFRRFIQSIPNMKSPALASTADGFLYAAWRGAEGRLFSAQFQPGGFVQYVSFKPAPAHAGIRLRDLGSRPVDSLVEAMDGLGVFVWAAQ